MNTSLNKTNNFNKTKSITPQGSFSNWIGIFTEFSRFSDLGFFPFFSRLRAELNLLGLSGETF
jgi:hypothetical protein